jgi:hypothetical protein
MRAPSSMNTQPWNFYIITGEPLDRIRAGNTERNLAGVPHSREFRIGTAASRASIANGRSAWPSSCSAPWASRATTRKARQDWVLRGFRQFDAPVCVIVTFDKELQGSDDAPFDCGAVATALVNAAWSRGLGAVINSQGIMQSPVVREHAGVADDQVIMRASPSAGRTRLSGQRGGLRAQVGQGSDSVRGVRGVGLLDPAGVYRSAADLTVSGVDEWSVGWWRCYSAWEAGRWDPSR